MIQRDSNGRVSFGLWDFAIHGIILLSLVQFCVETLPDLSPRTLLVLQIVETATVTIFTAEYLLRLWLARPRRAYLFSFLGVVDLLSIAPSLLGLAVDLRSLRVLRFLRFFRILKMTRYNAALQRVEMAFILVRDELVLVGATALIVMYLASVGIYYFEHEAQPDKFRSVFDGFWWALETLTTVGYGDIHPITVGGKAFTFVVLVVGLGVVSVPTGLLASALLRVREVQKETPDAPTPEEPKAPLRD